jgi:catechol 2,3-dioxygenase-like lactoylglutathione lyase family enzyme
MMAKKVDHVGINVDDLPAAKAFFLDLGLEVQDEDDVVGEWVDRIIGLENAHSTIVFMRVPNGETGIELIKFHSPVDEGGVQPVAANTLGIRHLAIAVEDLDATVSKLKERGTELVGEVQRYEDVYKLCYVRGPEGIIIELAEEIG